MLNRKPLFTAIAAAGLCLTAVSANAADYNTLTEVCNTTITETSLVDCGFASETLPSDCKINLAPDVNLSINGCYVNAAEYKVEIKGDTDARVQFNVNGSISNAAKIKIDMKGHGDAECTGKPDYLSPIYAYNYDLSAKKVNDKEGKVEMKVGCGAINVDLDYYRTLYGENKVSLETENGDITVVGNPSSPYSKLSSEADGEIKVKAGGAGVVTILDTTLEAGKIEVKSEGGSSVVD